MKKNKKNKKDKMILITKAKCQKCSWVKDKLATRTDIYEFDVTNSDLPILINGQIIVTGAMNIMHYLGIDVNKGERNG